MTLRQPAREFYEGITQRRALRISPAGRERAGRLDRELVAGGATTSWEVTAAASGAAEAEASGAASSRESGLMATEAGGLRATGGPFGKRSG